MMVEGDVTWAESVIVVPTTGEPLELVSARVVGALVTVKVPATTVAPL